MPEYENIRVHLVPYVTQTEGMKEMCFLIHETGVVN